MRPAASNEAGLYVDGCLCHNRRCYGKSVRKTLLSFCEMKAMITFVQGLPLLSCGRRPSGRRQRPSERSSVRKTAAGSAEGVTPCRVEGRALAGFQGRALNPSGEPTTTEAQPVVIVGYIKASLEVSLPLPLFVRCPPVLGYCTLCPCDWCLRCTCCRCFSCRYSFRSLWSR